MRAKIKVGIIGGAGYTGGELLRLLLHHPDVEIAYVVSTSQKGKAVSELHHDLVGETELYFVGEAQKGADVVFLCLPHGESKKYLEANNFLYDAKIIDLSRDFRIQNSEPGIKNFIYGLPELNKNKIAEAQYVANPGCFATAIQLSLLPLAKNSLLNSNIHVNATTGSTGAGQSLSETTHFTWRNNNLSVYKAFEHEHLPEIQQGITALQKNYAAGLHFIPQRGAFTRGILSTTTVTTTVSQQETEKLFADYFSAHPFVHLTKNADLKQVSNTNKCFIQLIKHNDQLGIVTVIDNLLKGASGQAVQNMNLQFGLEETAGLKLKANVF